MTEVGIASLGADFDALHVMRIVRCLNEKIWRDGFGKGWSTGSAIKLVERTEERLTGSDIGVEPGTLVLPEFILEGSLGYRFGAPQNTARALIASSE